MNSLQLPTFSSLFLTPTPQLPELVPHDNLIQHVDDAIAVYIGIYPAGRAALTEMIAHLDLVKDVHHPVAVNIAGEFHINKNTPESESLR